MKIAVCVKQVPDTTEIRIDPVKKTLIRQGVPSITNPFDVNAIEAALRLKDQYSGEVTAICMGPEQAKAVLRQAISMGADNAYLVTDRAFGGSDYHWRQAGHRRGYRTNGTLYCRTYGLCTPYVCFGYEDRGE